MERQVGLDNLKVFLTFLVVFHHVVMVYGGAPGWYWREVTSTSPVLVAINSINQSFFMGLFFLLSGYFLRASLEAKGVVAVIKSRALRLGLPLLCYFFVISPFTIALAHPEVGGGLLDRMLRVMSAGLFEPGPLWFIFALLIFSSVYAVVFLFFPTFLKPLSKRPSHMRLGVVLLAFGGCAFVVRLFFPTGETFLWLQLGHFPMYVLLFVVGAQAYLLRLLEHLPKFYIVPWLCLSCLLIMLLPVIIRHPVGVGPFEGGVNVNAAFYAVWEPFVACGIILALLYVFPKYLGRASNVGDMFSRSAYGIYIVHPPVVVFSSLLLSGADISLWIKLLLNTGLSLSLCILFTIFVLKIPYVSKVL